MNQPSPELGGENNSSQRDAILCPVKYKHFQISSLMQGLAEGISLHMSYASPLEDPDGSPDIFCNPDRCPGIDRGDFYLKSPLGRFGKMIGLNTQIVEDLRCPEQHLEITRRATLD